MTDITSDSARRYSENPEAKRARTGQVEPTAEQWAEIDRLVALGLSAPESRKLRPTPRSLNRWQCDVCGDYSLRSGSYHAALGWFCDRQKCAKVSLRCTCMQCQFPEDHRIRRNAARDKFEEEKRQRDE